MRIDSLVAIDAMAAMVDNNKITTISTTALTATTATIATVPLPIYQSPKLFCSLHFCFLPSLLHSF
ncbi:MAG TPA: hypothetical protein ENK52_03185 [Saprospiraceae bacterium]|nr:hypothetical protein [Saprospiraceae bacterium]